METSKQILDVAGLNPKLQLGVKSEHGVVSTGPHTVKLIKDKEVMGKDEKGNPIPFVRYLVEENGELKTYDTRKFTKGTQDISYLVQNLAGYDEGTIVILEMKKQGVKNYVQVSLVSAPQQTEVEDDDMDIPIVEGEEKTA